MGSFNRIMQRGQQRVKTTSETKALLCEMSDGNHKLIAKVIAHWLAEDEKKKLRHN